MRRPLRACFACSVLVAAATVSAATYTVDRIDDVADASTCADDMPADCSLRGAIRAANANPGADTVILPAGLYTLTIPATDFEDAAANGDLDVTDDLTLTGAGADTTIIQACDPGGAATCQGIDRVFDVGPGQGGITVTISGVTVRFGYKNSYADHEGGGLRNSATMNLTDSVVTGNTASNTGGGIVNHGTASLTNTVVSANLGGAFGGGIYDADGAAMTLSGCTVSDNTSDNAGGIWIGSFDIANPSPTVVTLLQTTVSGNVASDAGGIARNRGRLIVRDSTITGNTATAGGGGVFSGGEGGGIFSGGWDNGPNLISNSTISGNHAVGGGGINAGANVTILNCTIADNVVTSVPNAKTAVGGGLSGGSGVTVGNTIIARNTSDSQQSPDCVGTMTSLGHNLVQTSSGCGFSGDTTGNILDVDAGLGVLADNGGPTETQALEAGSPAIDAGNPAPPGSGGNACPGTDQRGFLRPRGAACDIGALERLGGFAISRVTPSTAGNAGSVAAILSGTGFAPGATVALRRAGQADVVGNPVSLGGDTLITTTFDVTGKATGAWDVVVTNPDDTTAMLPTAFAVEEARAPDLWVEFVGRPFVRAGSSVRYTILYGNRGNVDAIGVPLTLSLTSDIGFGFILTPVPPPAQTGQALPSWDWVPATVSPDPASGGGSNVPLLLPLVPAGFTGSIDVILSFPLDFSAGSVTTAIGTPYFTADGTLDPQVVATFVQGAQDYVQTNFVAPLSPDVLPDLVTYVTAQLTQAVADGRQAFVTGFGAQQVYSVTQLVMDQVLFAVTEMPASASTRLLRYDLQHLYRWMEAGFLALERMSAPTEASADGGGVLPPTPRCALPPGPGGICVGGCDCVTDPEKIWPSAGSSPPPECVVDFGAGNISDVVSKLSDLIKKCPQIPIPKDRCESLPDHKISASGGGCIPSKCTKASNVSSDPGCWAFPITPKNDIDPNDKTGSLGVTDMRFLRAGVPRVGYVVEFQNDPLKATAPAQQVVVTDPLDPSLDLDTLALGPISFGDRTVVPQVQDLGEYTASLDLDTVPDLLVLLDVKLDRDARTLTWRFTSVDPATGELPDDVLVGFLPPDVTPPEGEGTLSFTVAPKADVPAGTQICNQASIVFDTNAPLATPQWCNAVDETPPSSHVLALAPTQSSPTFSVDWTGTDAGSGILDYGVYVSKDGGPFQPVVVETTATSTTFTGVVGSTYAFFSVARDVAGNVEAKAPVGEAQTTIAGGTVVSTTTTTTGAIATTTLPVMSCDALPGVAAVECLCTGGLFPASCGNSVPVRVAKLFARGCAGVGHAAALAPGRKTNRLLGKASAAFNKASRLITANARTTRKLTPACRQALGSTLADVASRTAGLRVPQTRSPR